MSSALRGVGRLVLLLVWLLWGVGCSAGAATTVAPPPSPTIVINASPTDPPPSATMAAAVATARATATPAATAAATKTAPPAITETATLDPALAVIYNYLDARARADVADVTALACQAFQGQAATEAVSFRSMQAKLQDVVCAVNGLSGPYTLVGCGGKIITTYGTETREWDLSSFVYQALLEDGAWKMCGYH